MTLHTIDASAAAADLGQFDAVIDARSPAEFAEDHLPGAVNWPVLDDDERRIVGTLFVQDSPLAARKVGAAMAARNVAAHIERWVATQPRTWRPLVYCWRGGQRSGSLAWFLDQIGFRTHKLQGGYKGFRAVVRDDLCNLPQRFRFGVVAGRTGSGKTRLLHALSAAGAQVLDLEALACHRGSVLGGLPEVPQPTQKAFDTSLWCALRTLDPQRPVYVESESRKIGRLQLPDALVAQMHEHGFCLRVEMDDAARVELLLQDYAHFTHEPERFCELLEPLVELRGRQTVSRWQEHARAGRWADVYAQMMVEHYDPLYLRSIDRNYTGYADAPSISLVDGSPQALRQAARDVMEVCEGDGSCAKAPR